MKTQKLLFIGDARVDGKIIFEKGQVYDVPIETGSASRWIRRGVAIEYAEKEIVESVPVVEETTKENEIKVEVDEISTPKKSWNKKSKK